MTRYSTQLTSDMIFSQKVHTPRSIIIVVISLMYLGYVHAATEIEIENERTTKGDKHIYTIKALFQGPKARYTFHTQDYSDIVSGSYLFTHDGGKTTYFISINEEADEKVCHQWANQEFVKMMGKYLLKVTDKFNVNVSDLVVTKEFEKKAKEIHGLPTKHIRITANFTASYDFVLFSDNLTVEQRIDTWVTPKIEGVETKPILQRSWRITGFEQIDQALKSLSDSVVGYRLRNKVVQTITNKKGKKTKTRIVENVKSIKKIEKVPKDAFKIPNCTKIDSYEMEQRAKHLLMVLAGKPL